MTILFSLRSRVVRFDRRAKAPIGTSFSWFPRRCSVRSACRLAKALGSSVEIKFSLRSTSSSRGYGARSPGDTQRSRFRLRSSSRVSVGMPSGTPDRRFRWQDTERSWAAHSQRGGQLWHTGARANRVRLTPSQPRPHRAAMSTPPPHSRGISLPHTYREAEQKRIRHEIRRESVRGWQLQMCTLKNMWH